MELASCPVAERQEARVRWVPPVRSESETTLWSLRKVEWTVPLRLPMAPLPEPVLPIRMLLKMVTPWSLPLTPVPEGWEAMAEIWIAQALEPSRASKVLLTIVMLWQPIVG